MSIIQMHFLFLKKGLHTGFDLISATQIYLHLKKIQPKPDWRKYILLSNLVPTSNENQCAMPWRSQSFIFCHNNLTFRFHFGSLYFHFSQSETKGTVFWFRRLVFTFTCFHNNLIFFRQLKLHCYGQELVIVVLVVYNDFLLY